MAAPTEKNLNRRRGDTYPFAVTVNDTQGTPVNISGCSFWWTADPEQAPAADTNNIFSIAGVIESAVGGEVHFNPSTTDTDHVGVFYHDVQMIDGDGVITTLIAGTLTLVEDITKDEVAP